MRSFTVAGWPAVIGEQRSCGLRPNPRAHALRSALELRYQVYCIECNFLSPDDYPDGVETDEYDKRSYHFYAFDEAEELVGYVRLVRADPGQHFPFQHHCDLTGGVELPPSGGAAEISRLMVRSDYRRRKHSDRLSNVTPQQNAEALSGERRHQAPQVLLSLYRQMFQFSLAHGIGHWYAAMEKPLARSLSRLGFSFQSIGPATDYYGPVAPYLTDLASLQRQIGAHDPALLEWLLQDGGRRAHSPATPAVDPPVSRADTPWMPGHAVNRVVRPTASSPAVSLHAA